MNGDRLLSLSILGGSIALITYAWIHYRHSPSPNRVRKEGGTFLLGEGFMSIVYHLVTPLINRLVERNTNANTITWLSLPLGALSGIAAAKGIWSGAALLFSGLCDMLDGALARKQHKASPSGAMSRSGNIGQVAYKS